MIDLDAARPTPIVSVIGRFVNAVSAAHLAELLTLGAARLEIEAERPRKERFAIYFVQLRETCYVVSREDGKSAYELPLTLSSCSCGDATYRAARPGGCRHRRGLEQALAAFGLGRAP